MTDKRSEERDGLWELAGQQESFLPGASWVGRLGDTAMRGGGSRSSVHNFTTLARGDFQYLIRASSASVCQGSHTTQPGEGQDWG